MHFCGNKILGCVCGAIDLLRVHGGKVKKEQHQPPVAGVQRRDGFFPASQEVSFAGGTGNGRFGRSGGQRLIDVLEIKRGDLLLLPVFQQGEIFFFQIADDVAFFVVRYHVH